MNFSIKRRAKSSKAEPVTHRLAIVSTHAIQYLAPVFRHLAQNEPIEIKVFFGWEGQGYTVDPGFGKVVK